MKRREFLVKTAVLGSILLSGCSLRGDNVMGSGEITEGEERVREVKSKVYVIKTTDREGGVKSLLAQFEVGKLSGKQIGRVV